MKSTKQATKQVEIISRKETLGSNQVAYKVLSSNGVDTYTTILISGHAVTCNCPATKPCYHMIQLEDAEAERKADMAWARTYAKIDRAIKVYDATVDGITSFFAAVGKIMEEETAKAEALFAEFDSPKFDSELEAAILQEAEQVAILAQKRAASASYLAKMDEEVAERIASEKAAPAMPKSDQGRLAGIMDASRRYSAPLNGNREFSLTK